jgi:hypothetical protein
MRPRRLIVPTLLGFFLALGFTPTSFAGPECGQILEHGVFNTTTTYSLSFRTQTLINWLSQSTFESFGQAKDAAANLGFEIGGIPFELGGHSRETDWHNYQSYLQTLNFSDEKTLQQFSQVLTAADAAIVDAWKSCILNNKGVSHAVAEMSYDPKVFTINLIYDPEGPPAEATITSFTITPSSVECDPPVHTTYGFRTSIPSSQLILHCTRKSASDAVQVTGNTLKGPLSAKLPGVMPPSGGPNTGKIADSEIVVVEYVPTTPTDFKPRNPGQSSGCACAADNRITFPGGPYNVKVNEEFLFRYDGSPTWHAQGFDRFQGIVNWGPKTTTLHDLQPWSYMAIFGILKVKFTRPGDYNVVVDMYADCLDAFYNCRNTCSAHGTTEVHVH